MNNNSGIPFPNKKYKIIYADPPWSYFKDDFYSDERSTSNNHYSTMTTDEIKSLPIQNISDENCILFLWATWPCLKDALAVISSWGFTYKTIGFDWFKTNQNDSKFFFGIGNYTKSNSEPCLLATKGNGSKLIKSNYISSVVKTTRAKHSEKPDEVRKRILELVGDIPRIELFARTKVHGWDTWGNDEKLNLQPLEAFNQ